METLSADTAVVPFTEEQCLELHKILTLEKFIPYSKVSSDVLN